MQSRGQGGDVFVLLIGAVLGLAMLVIVMGVVGMFDDNRFQLSAVRFEDGFETALNLPTGQEVVQESLFFKQGVVLNARGLASSFNVAENCITFSSGHSKAIPSPDGKSIAMENTVQANIYYRCENTLNPAGDSCRPYCEISFGKSFS